MTTEQNPDGNHFDAVKTDRPAGQERTHQATTVNQSHALTVERTQRTAERAATTVAAVGSAPPRNRSFWPRFFVKVTVAGLAIVALVFAGLIIAYRWIDPPTTTLIFGQRLAGTEIRQQWRPLERISPNLVAAVITSEDTGFCRHRGVDWTELEAAYERGQEGGNAGGGSTISMQLIKNLFLWPSRSYVRKAIEIPMTLASELIWSKPRIIEMYLNIAELGPGIFGAEAASRYYFRKPASDLTAREAALLASALPNPLQRDAAHPTPLHRTLASRLEGRLRVSGRFTQCVLR